MPNINALQESFNAGEFGLNMHNRVQFDKYRNAGAIYQNVLPMAQGGFTARPGFRYIADAISASVAPWLIKFQFSTTQSYMLEFGDNKMRFFRNQAQISVANTDAAITNGDFPTNIAGWTDKSTGTGVIAHDAVALDMELQAAGSGNEAIAEQAPTTSATGVEHVLKFRITGDMGDKIIVRIGASSGGNDYSLDINGNPADLTREVGWHTVAFTPAVSPFFIQFENGDTKTISVDDIALFDDAPVELPTPWSAAQMPDVSFAQSADIIHFAIGGSTRVYKLIRYGHETWSLIKQLFEDGPYLDQNITTTTLNPAATSGTGIVVTASSIIGINDDKGFQSTDVGRLIRYKDNTPDWHWMQIVEVADTLNVKVDIKGETLHSNAASADWRLGEWSDALGWPSVTGFVQQRSAWAATTTKQQTFWLSKSADIYNLADEDMTGTVQDDSSINYTFAALEVNTIRWMASRKKPIIGTEGGQWTLISDGKTLTPTDISADFEVSGGVARIQPLSIRNKLLFANSQKRKIMEFVDTVQESGALGFDQFDLTLLNDRVLQGGTTQLAHAAEPNSVIWATRADGQIPSLTYQPEQSVIGWARHIHGGVFQGGDAVVESIATIPGQNGAGQFKDSSGRHEVWVAVKMEINGSTVRYIECQEKAFNGDEDLQQDAFYVDSGLTRDVPLAISGATKAWPVVVTVTGNTFSDADLIRSVRVKGMTELNGGVHRIFERTANTYELAEQDGTGITAITKANPGVITIPGHGLTTADEVAVFDAGGTVEVNGNGYTITVIDVDNISIGVDTSAFTTYTFGGSVHLATDGTAFTAYAADGEARLMSATVTGLDHLEAAVVQVFADGAVQTDKTVSSGAITLDEAASIVHVGLAYERRWKSLKLAYGARGGTAVGRPKSIADIILDLMETAEGALEIATVENDVEGEFTPLDFRTADNVDGDPVPFFTGETELGVSASYDEDIRIVLVGTAPVPSTVRGIAPVMDTVG